MTHNEKKGKKFAFFYGHTKGKDLACLSNWYPAPFDEDGVHFTDTEMYMMYHKALLFKDEEMAKKILNASSPKESKALGRKVRGFREDVWVANREIVMYKGCFQKFESNIELKKELLSTYPSTLVEASPYDKIWGIGMRSTDEGVDDPTNWKGLNLLGKTLTKVRDQLISVDS